MPEQRVVRRLVAILVADVAGYSRMMGVDEEGTHQRLKAHLEQLVEPKIKEHRGRTVKNTGDGFLSEFASVVDAVRCAVEIQSGMRARERDVPDGRCILFRIGINLGDVIVEEHDIFGDGVNVAARLETLAEPGGICISRVVRDQVRDKLDIAFEDMGEQQVKNIARPVRVYRVRGADAADKISSAPAVSVLPLPDKPSVAVLPFTNMSGDPEQEFFADGIAEDVITALSRFPALFVIARNSSFIYKGRAVDVKQVGRELGVRYVLEGGLRKSGNRIRVTAQLVEAETGRHVWAERYDRDLADIFALQDEIAGAVTIAVAPAVEEAERQRAMRKPPQNLDAWAAYQRGLWHFSKGTPDDNALAERFFERAIDLDPSFAGGYTGLAYAQIRATGMYGRRSLAEIENSALALARRAVSLDGNDAEARACFAEQLMRHGNYQGALAEVELALTISPNLANAHGVLGAVLMWSGQPKKGRPALEKSSRLDPRNPNLNLRLLDIAISYYLSREYDSAVEAGKRGIRSYPDHSNHYRWLAAALGQTGHIEEAKEVLAKAIAMAPAAFDMFVHRRVPWHRPEDHAHMLDGLRKAGWSG
ncbi:MAG TPA: adenylate/guanylate cyclase domain-containing protein [Stellaceae bacterium]|nr:adenylate/guanylate cyclase domain-containing protein [Stellaceae bacterium]